VKERSGKSLEVSRKSGDFISREYLGVLLEVPTGR
jgi:hypothetical protein